ncbi:Endoplasmic reticulum-Golgi intermediate compartment protein 2 [Rhizophlyctis rosea]|uniref:Endoplasmic reticulum-Golgi intermediate compartment protein 2 n=1 Tax=Rhizophlyctis rosea TaxID=64517 RepID=A0AAD5SBS2_9FUNG|nr:Endoplasmic reticulum-Golgi intermediate compartment protein 2 [Rhizophlyctis rosea]
MLTRLAKRLTHLDAFPKVERNIQHATGSGGALTLVVAFILSYLVFSEYAMYRAIDQKYEFLVDQTRSQDHALDINMDLTIAMECAHLRADVLDASGESLQAGEVNMEPVVWTPISPAYRRLAQFGHKPVSEQPLNVHNLVNQAAREARDSSNSKGNGGEKSNACRITGTVPVNKVSGMLHFTALGHGYFGAHVSHDAMNFTHRIDKLSYGRRYPGLTNPLDRTVEFATTKMEMFQYFVAIVPTIYVDNRRTFGAKVLLTNQYAVTDYSRELTGQNTGVPGIFIKYGIEPISVRITEQRHGLMHFLTRLCGIVGGVFVTVGVALDVFRWFHKQYEAFTPSKTSFQ